MNFTMKKSSISISNQPGEEGDVILVIEGELVIKNADLIKKKLVQTLQDFQKIKIELRNIERLDISAIQLILAFRKSALMQGKAVIIIPENTKYVSSVLQLSGTTMLFN